MDFSQIEGRGIVLLGCGRMGSALLDGWLAKGLSSQSVWVQEPDPSEHLRAAGVRLNAGIPADPALALIAVKPQMMDHALPALAPLAGRGTIFLSIAAGTPIASFESRFGADSPVIRAMPNTPAAIGQGITALVGNAAAGEDALRLAEALLSAVGQTVRLDAEAQMDAVTALSGSGPAYVFHLIESMAEAGAAEGLPPELAMQLARATVAGAGQLAVRSDDPPATLRENVTSPGGTTFAALSVLMDAEAGLPPLMRRTIAAAAARARELSQ